MPLRGLLTTACKRLRTRSACAPWSCVGRRLAVLLVLLELALVLIALPLVVAPFAFPLFIPRWLVTSKLVSDPSVIVAALITALLALGVTMRVLAKWRRSDGLLTNCCM